MGRKHRQAQGFEFHPITWWEGAETGETLGLTVSQPSQLGKFQASEELCHKNKVNVPGEMTQ